MNLIKCSEVMFGDEACLGYIRSISDGLILNEAFITRCRLISMPSFHGIGFTLTTLRLFGLSLYLALNDLWTNRL